MSSNVEPLDKDLVYEFVAVAHKDLERVKELLEREPALIHASWDWGEGNWETALDAASHMGNKAIAEYLLSKSAKMDVFCAAMLGKIEIVNAFLADNPEVIHAKGVHGFDLLHHANAGKQDAVVELLKSYGATS